MFSAFLFLASCHALAALVVRQQEANNSETVVTSFGHSQFIPISNPMASKTVPTNFSSHGHTFHGGLVYDLGFYDGMDSWQYLHQGMQVIAVEADPTLVQNAKSDAKFQPFIQNGTLVILNLAIAPKGQAESVETAFYLNKCNKEWNSFFPSVGCRSCEPPYQEDLTRSSCTVMKVMSTPCLQVLQKHKAPVYMKGDMEGGETGCFQALFKYPIEGRPQYISGELLGLGDVDAFAALGYTSFKIVQQVDQTSGAWGDPAVDCRHGGQWRSQASANAELKRMYDKNVIQAAPCPSMVAHGVNVWYDVHASKTPPQVWS